MPSSPAFSLTELLVVIGILIILVGMTVVIVGKAYRTGQSTRVRADFNAIAIALGQYANDFKGAYPMSFDPNTGKASLYADHILAKALIGPGKASNSSGSDPLDDGADGPGFRVAPNGKVYPPYLSPEKFKTSVVISSDGSNQRAAWELLDIFGTPIAYMPKRSKGRYLVDINHVPNEPAMYDRYDLVALTDGELQTGSNGYLGGDPVDDQRSVTLAQCVAIVLGDICDPNSGLPNNRIDGSETLRHDGPFLLMSAGPDQRFFTPRGIPLPKLPKTLGDDTFAADNIYNFDR